MQQQAMRARKGVFAGAVAAALAATLMIPSLAYADPTASEKQAEAQAALASLNSMQSTLNRTSVVYDEALAAQREAEAKRDEAQARIDEANGQIADLQTRLGSRARSMYRTGGRSFLDLLLGATTFQEFSTGWDMLNTLNENDADLVQQTKDLRAEVQEQQAAYAEQQRVAAEKADEALRSKQEAASTMSAMQATYDSLSAEAAELLEQERAAQAAADAAQAQAVVEASARQAQENANASGNVAPGNDPSPSPSPAPSEPSGPSYNPVTGNAIVDRAYGCIGLPYSWGGVGPSSFDCSGLVSYAVTGSFSRWGTTNTFMGMSQVGDPQPGDIATSWGHCGIYIGNGQMIHAPTFGQTVCISPVQGDMIIVRP